MQLCPRDRGEAVAARARALIGVQFRMQGRSAGEGLDCVGVAALAAGLANERVPRNYCLRGTSLVALEAALRGLGFEPAAGAAAPGDVVLFAPGAAQLHLGIFTGAGFVHADAGLRRVVERPLPPPWPVVGAWRFCDAKGASEWQR